MLDILIYDGLGAGKLCVQFTRQLLTNILSNKYNIKTICESALINSKWEQKTALLVMPGGYDLGYVEKLQNCKTYKDRGNQKIAAYVKSGGKYLGICAGAYYAGDNIEFESCGFKVQEHQTNRTLKFFPGKIIGPSFSGFDPLNTDNYLGAHAPEIEFNGDRLAVFYFGGGHFIAPEKYSNVEVLAKYSNTNMAAIVQCKVGEGTAILSGPHFEWQPTEVFMHPNLINIKDILLDSESKRQKLASHILSILGLEQMTYLKYTLS